MNSDASPAPGHPPLRVLLLGAGFGTDNRGVAALAAGALTSVFHAFPHAEVAFLDYAKAPRPASVVLAGTTRHIATVALRFSRRPTQPNHILRLLVTAALLRLAPATRRARIIARSPVLTAIAEADLLGALSGGDSFGDLYGLRRLLYVALPQLLVLLLGRPLVLLPQNYGPCRSALSRLIVRTILQRARLVYSRDAAGVATVRRLAPAAADRTSFALDLGFALEPHPAPHALLQALAPLAARGPVVGLNVSGLLHADDDRFGLRAPYATAMRALVLALVADHHASVVLIPHVFGHGGESDVSASLALVRTLPDAIAGHVMLCTAVLDQHEVKDLIGRCDFFVGSRMHACIAALSQAVPTLSLAYSDKFTGVLASVGAADHVLDLRTATSAELVAAVGHALARRAARRAELEAAMPAVRAAARGFFGALAARLALAASTVPIAPTAPPVPSHAT